MKSKPSCGGQVLILEFLGNWDYGKDEKDEILTREGNAQDDWAEAHPPNPFNQGILEIRTYDDWTFKILLQGLELSCLQVYKKANNKD